jgi:HK97 family phage major capsid protein
MQAELSALLRDAKNVLEATKFLTGSGTNEPFGILTGATELVETATGKKWR